MTTDFSFFCSDETNALAHEQLLRHVVNEINYGYILLTLLTDDTRALRVQATLYANVMCLIGVAETAKNFLGQKYIEKKQGETRKFTTLGQCLAESHEIHTLKLSDVQGYS